MSWTTSRSSRATALATPELSRPGESLLGSRAGFAHRRLGGFLRGIPVEPAFCRPGEAFPLLCQCCDGVRVNFVATCIPWFLRVPVPRSIACRSWCEPFVLCSLGFGRQRGMTAEKGKFMKKSAAVTSGAILALGAAAPAFAASGADGAAVGDPGVLSGNVVQAPVDIQVNVCGNTIDVIGLLNSAFGNTCTNG